MTSQGIAIGLKSLRGYQVTKIQKAKKTPKKHTKNLLVKDVIREITGLAPYEKRVQEFIKNGLDKRALRLASRRLGSYQRGKKKREELAALWRNEQVAGNLKEKTKAVKAVKKVKVKVPKSERVKIDRGEKAGGKKGKGKGAKGGAAADGEQ